MRTLLILAVLATAGACTTEEVARGAAAWKRNECGKILDKAEYDRCMRRTEVTR